MTARVIPHTKARPALRGLGVLLMVAGVALPSLWSLAQKPPAPVVASGDQAAVARPLSPALPASAPAAPEGAPPSTATAALSPSPTSGALAAPASSSTGRALAAPGHRPTPAAFSSLAHEGATAPPHRGAAGARSASPRLPAAARKAEASRPPVVSEEPYGLPPRNSEAWSAPALPASSSARPRLLVEEPPRIKVLE